MLEVDMLSIYLLLDLCEDFALTKAFCVVVG